MKPAIITHLLGACRTHNNLVLAERIAERALELDPKEPSIYVLLGNMYAAAKAVYRQRQN